MRLCCTKGTGAVDTFYYSNPSNGFRLSCQTVLNFSGHLILSSSIPFPIFLLNPQTFDPPLVDVTYKLQVSDSFGCVSESSFYYKSIHVKADFSLDPEKGEAPLEVTFTDKSVRASKYKWEFGDTSTSKLKRS